MAQAGDLNGAAGAPVGAAANGAAVLDGFDDFDLPENFLGDAVNNGPAAAAQNQGPQQPLDLETRIENALRRSEERLALRFQNQLSTTVEDALSTSLASKKRKADQIKNEGIKKQYIPVEEATLRMKAVRSSLAEAVDEQTPLGPADAEKLRDHLDEGIKILEKRMAHLEIAQQEGWDVAKKMEDNELVLSLPEEMRAQLKKAKKEAKEEEKEKKESKNSAGKKGFKKGGKPWMKSQFGGGFGGFQKGAKGPCFSYGQFDHISATCPNKAFAAMNAVRHNP